MAWDDLLGTIERDSWGPPYRIVLKKLRRATPSLTETLKLNTLDQIVNNLFSNDIHWDSVISADDDKIWQEEYDVNIQEMYSILRKKSSANKAPGIDGIKSVFLRRIPKAFLKKLTSIYNMYIRKGEFPKIWKRSILILIPKGELNLPIPKVRPICLLSELGKTFERIIEARLQDWMDRHPESRLAANQFGFRRNTSICDALLVVQEFVTDARADREVVVGVSLDITNAFNSLKWSCIRQALKDKGFPTYLRKIIDSYLSDREIEYPTVEGTTHTRKITAGVPQDLVLGPTLWNITYDWVLRTPLEEGCVILGYADDTLILSIPQKRQS